MKKYFILTVCAVLFSIATAYAQADKIVGVYASVHEGNSSKIKVSKVNGGYRAQVIWLEKLHNEDGTVKTDKKNPDKAKRNTPANKIVLIEKVTYNAKKDQWDDGKIYEPTSGKSWTVTCSFKDAKTLKVRGSFGPFGKSVYWPTVE